MEGAPEELGGEMASGEAHRGLSRVQGCPRGCDAAMAPESREMGTGARDGGELGPRAAFGVGASLASDPSGTGRGAHTGTGILGTEQDGGCIQEGVALYPRGGGSWKDEEDNWRGRPPEPSARVCVGRRLSMREGQHQESLRGGGGNPDRVLTGGEKARVGVQSAGRPKRSWRFPCRGGAAVAGECGRGGLPSGSYRHRRRGNAKPVMLSLNSGPSI